MDETQPFRAAGLHPAVTEPLSGGGGRQRWQAHPHATHDCCHVSNKQSSREGGNHVLPLKEAGVTRGRRQPPPAHTARSQPEQGPSPRCRGPLFPGTLLSCSQQEGWVGGSSGPDLHLLWVLLAAPASLGTLLLWVSCGRCGDESCAHSASLLACVSLTGRPAFLPAEFLPGAGRPG